MRNKFEIRGDVTAIFLKTTNNKPIVTLIDTAMLDKVAAYENHWRAEFKKLGGCWYAYARKKIDDKAEYFYLHKFLTGLDNRNFVVDHINHNTLDNRLSNLRIVTPQQNAENRKGANVNSKSGIRGVSWHTKANKWVVQVGFKNEHYYFGLYDDIREAEKVAIEARRKLLSYSSMDKKGVAAHGEN